MWKVALATLVTLFNGNPNVNLYATTFVVSETKETSDTVILTDMFSGQQFSFKGIEDWRVGDLAACVMSDNATETIYDDSILSIKYAGWVELKEELTCGNES